MEARDKKVIDFIHLVELATKEQVQKLYFEGVHRNICMRRLKKISEDGYVERFKHGGNIFVYYVGKKPSKRLINHDLYITDFIVEMMKNGFEILEFKKSFVIGPIISDAYVRYKDPEGKIRHCVLEVQLSNKVSDCVDKYKDFKSIILDNRSDWGSIPRVIVITDMTQRIELRGIKVLYDTTEMKNVSKILTE